MSPGMFIVIAVAVMAGSVALVGWVQHKTGPVDDEGGVPTIHRSAGRARYVYAALGVVFVVTGLVVRDGKVLAGGLVTLLGAWGQHWLHGLTKR
jgi:hypothetical protein